MRRSFSVTHVFRLFSTHNVFVRQVVNKVSWLKEWSQHIRNELTGLYFVRLYFLFVHHWLPLCSNETSCCVIWIQVTLYQIPINGFFCCCWRWRWLYSPIYIVFQMIYFLLLCVCWASNWSTFMCNVLKEKKNYPKFIWFDVWCSM